jgi:hypothetical protein
MMINQATEECMVVDREALRDVTTNLPEHLINLPGSGWALWRSVCLRGAGFPASQVLKLSAPQCAAAADQLLELEEAAERARQNAAQVIEQQLDDLRARGEWGASRTRAPLFRAMHLLNARKVPQSFGEDASVGVAIEAFREASAKAQAAKPSFMQAYRDAAADLSAEIREVADCDRFREAIIWQNRPAFHNHVVRVLARALPEKAAARSRRQRRDEELIANYLQRYCVKNDTIGFFGPVGWARFVSQGETITARPGADVIEQRSVYFESWGIETLAEKIASNKEVLPWVAPRRVPYVHFERTALYLPLARPTMLTSKQAAVLQACANDRLALEIAATLRADSTLGFKSDEEVYKVIEGLCARGLVIWGFTFPLVPDPETCLRPLLERIEPPHLREPALASLSALESARDVVSLAAGEPERLDQALGELEQTFAQLTGAAATRAHGKTYGARTLVYEDCQRSIEIEIGPELLESLGPPLSLLLDSARWVSFQLAEMYRKIMEKVYNDLSRKGRSPLVDASSFWMHVQPLLFGETEHRPTDELEPLLQERWARVLSIPPGQWRVHYTAEQLRPLVLEAFDAPGPGWMAARNHSPDVMIAASSAEAIRRGDYQLSIGELHLGSNTLRAVVFISQHPAPDELMRAQEEDFPESRPIPIRPKSWPLTTVRTAVALNSPKDLGIEFAYDSICPDTMKAIPIADLVVESTGNGLLMRTRDGRITFDAVEAIGEALSTVAVNAMKILPAAKHSPRVTIDRLVVCRESWSFTVSELSFAEEKDEATRFLSARRWARSHDMPRFVFVKVLSETKPFYVDFDSPIYVDIFAKALRLLAEHPAADQPFTLTEMFPTPDQTWLSDAEGRHYTSELRMVAVDRAATADRDR